MSRLGTFALIAGGAASLMVSLAYLASVGAWPLVSLSAVGVGLAILISGRESHHVQDGRLSPVCIGAARRSLPRSQPGEPVHPQLDHLKLHRPMPATFGEDDGWWRK